jgi:Domain of unknown function (DUF4760)
MQAARSFLQYTKYALISLTIFGMVGVVSFGITLLLFILKNGLLSGQVSCLPLSTYLERPAFASSFLAILGSLSTFSAIYGLFITLYWNNRTDKRITYSLSLKFMDDWAKPEMQNSIQIFYYDYLNEAKDPNRQTLLNDLFRYVSQPNDESSRLRLALRTLLNLCEIVAIAYESEDVNRLLVEEFFKAPFTKLYLDLEPYLRAIQSVEGNQGAYKHFMDLAKSWLGKS